MNRPTNRAKIVNDNEAFPRRIDGVFLAAGADLTVEYGDGSIYTHVGLPVGLHPIRPRKLISGGPVEARWRAQDNPIIGPQRPEITGEVLALEADEISDINTSTQEIQSWETRDGEVRFTLKDEFSALPIRRRLEGAWYAEFASVAALEATGIPPTSSDVIIYALVMSQTPVSSYGFTIDSISNGEAGTAGATAAVLDRRFGSGVWRAGNGSAMVDGSAQVVPFKWYVLTLQYGATTASLRVNGVEEFSGEALPAPVVSGLTLGHGSVGGGTSHDHMAIAAYFMGDGKPDDTERDAVEAYLLDKYARVLNL